jgi:predicted small lipoprotein YifL
MRIVHYCLLLAISTGLAACGQKGPLVLRDSRTKAPVPVVAPAPPATNPDSDRKKTANPAEAVPHP